MTKSGGRRQLPSEVDNGARAEYEPPRIEALGTIEELTLGFSGNMTDNGVSFGSGPADTAASDRRLKAAVEPVDSRVVLRRVAAGL